MSDDLAVGAGMMLLGAIVLAFGIFIGINHRHDRICRELRIGGDTTAIAQELCASRWER